MPIPVPSPPAQILDPTTMAARRAQYFAYVRAKLPRYFDAHGKPLPDTEGDGRITFWAFPALIQTTDATAREFALRLLAASPCWDGWNIFTSSSIVAIAAREREQLPADLYARCRDHAARYLCIDRGRAPCSAANDYMFHGYNDNMPAMAVRALVLGGELADDCYTLDRGRFLLEGLAAQFHRCGLLAEYNSATYTPITVAALADVAELAADSELREMAAVCVNRMMLDILAHWHYGLGAPSGSSSRAYMTDRVQTISCANGLAWYLGLPGALDPAATITAGDRGTGYDVPFHHGPKSTHCLAQFCEFMVADYLDCLRPETIAYARREPRYPEIVRASSEAGRTAGVQTRTHRAATWSLGSADRTMWSQKAGMSLPSFANWTRTAPPASYRDRGQFWVYLQGDGPDVYDSLPAGYGELTAANTNCQDLATWRTVQTGGSLLAVGHPGTDSVGKTFDSLRLVLCANTYGQPADASWHDDRELAEWPAEPVSAGDSSWHFLRFGAVFIGLRTAGMSAGRPLSVHRRWIRGMYRLELLLNHTDGEPLQLDPKTRAWTDLGYVLELADASEVTFEIFRAQCLASRWEFGRCFYRNSRYEGRHGELQITDSVEPDDVKVYAIDGETEPHTMLQATDLPPTAVPLYTDGRRVRQRRLWYDPAYIGSPFYDIQQQRIVADRPGEDR